MPELPEVETCVRLLKKEVSGETFNFIWAEEKAKENSLKILRNTEIETIERRGKGIFFLSKEGKMLFIHLKMTGHLLLGHWEKKNGEWKSEEKIMQDPKNGFLRVLFFFKSGKQLALSDPRKFAKAEVLSAKEYEKKKKTLGPEPLSLSKNDFLNLFQKRKGKIKSLLMDQGFLAGIGNIYASEILFEAGVSPLRRANELKKKELEKIYEKMQSILKEAVRLKGDSTSDYRLPNGRKGGYQKRHRVYQRKGLPCPACKGAIERVKINTRGTYFCPKCQK